MPGMERAAPDRTETKSGKRASPKMRPVARSSSPMPLASNPPEQLFRAAVACVDGLAKARGDDKGGRNLQSELCHLPEIRGLGAGEFRRQRRRLPRRHR